MAENHPEPRAGAVLDIGGNIGALLLFTGADRLGQEIHVAPLTTTDHTHHHDHEHGHEHEADGHDEHIHSHDGIHGHHTIHTIVRSHPTPTGRATTAALFPELPAGDYQIVGTPDTITIRGGEVTQHTIT